MESYEKLKNLSESEKAKYFEALLESVKHATDDSSDPDITTNKKLSLDSMLNNLASGHIVSSEESPRKKQKTLDSWLIKPKATQKNETGESSRALEESSDVTLSSDTSNVSKRLDFTPLNSSSSTDENSVNSPKIDENFSKSVECLPCESDKLYKNCNVKAVQNSQPETDESTCIDTRKGYLRSKKKCTASSQRSKSKNSIKCSILTDNIHLHKRNTVITQSHISNNCDVNHDISPENIVSDHNSNAAFKESSDEILNSDTNGVSECLNFTQSKLNNLNDETSLSLAKIHENNTQNVEHSPCKFDKVSNNFVKDMHISQPEISESTCTVTRKSSLRSKKKCTELSQLTKSKNSTKASNFNDNVNLNKSNSVVTQPQIGNNTDVNHDISLENNIPECNSNVVLEKSHDVILSSNTNYASKCLDSTQSKLNNVNNGNSSSPSKINENSLQNVEHLPYKSGKVSDSLIKNIQISQPEVSESPRIVTRTRSKRKFIEPSENTTKSSTFTDNSSLKKSNRVITQSYVTNDCDVDYGASPENIVSESSNLASKNDSQEVDDLSFLNKGTRNLRSRKVSIILPSITQSSTKIEQNAAKTLDNSKLILSPVKDKSIDSSLSSNWEAFHILERECSRININVLDILQDETIQNVLNNPNRLDNDTFFFINSFKSSNERTLPVVHLVESWKKLPKIYKKLKQSV